ncbi:unnamed protein product [Oncorhynchus mykiss]|uniref:SMB domain-containing protein n=1 Tax=Oncorhynchus mykiss TaxID=8022 RepID=A0A060YAP5_ONCMY|nr:unnamed protein product [Oncorhynchus mykiss]
MTASSLLAALVVVTCAALLPFSAAQTSCSGRCGDPFARGQPCQCDASCLTHDECCKDFEALCTFGESCSGRCGESFRRGRLCECDPGCVRYDTCCRDYQNHCDTNGPYPGSSSPKSQRDYSRFSEDPASPLSPDFYPLTDSFNVPSSTAPDTVMDADALCSSLYASLCLFVCTCSNILHLTSCEALSDSATSLLEGISLLLPTPMATTPLALSSFTGQLPGSANFPSTGLPMPSQGGASADNAGPLALNPDLCSDLPLNGLTTLANGTILIFKGHFFWTIDPITKDHGPAHNIREELGIPSPIDSAFTRTNCQGKSYIIKGDDYWRMDNGNMEPGYPKSVASGFHGLTGTITAALPVPATRRRPESVYFFKKKYSYHAESSTVCGKKSKPSAKKRHARQTEMSLGAEINIKLALKGFPSSVTSAVSVPSPKKADGYDYFLFAGPLYFNIKISGDLPALAKPDNADPRQNSIKKWLKCI